AKGMLQGSKNSFDETTTFKKLQVDEKKMREILDHYEIYKGKTHLVLDAEEEVKADVSDILNAEKLSDAQISKMMIVLQESWRGEDEFGFAEKDYAISWFANHAHQNLNGED